MSTSISALEREPRDLIKEVSTDAIGFYVDELSGIHLPEDFKTANAGKFDVKYWKPEDRLRGKFGRFAVWRVEEDQKTEQLEGILLMGSTVGLSGLNRNGYMSSLRHFEFIDKVRGILEERDLLGEPITVDDADFGSTKIILGESGSAESLDISGASLDLGRAKTEGRKETCEMFARLLGDGILNSDPEPSPRERIVN